MGGGRLGRERRAHSRTGAGESPLRGHPGRGYISRHAVTPHAPAPCPRLAHGRGGGGGGGRRARAWTHTRVLISQGSFGSCSCRSAQKGDETKKLMGPGPQGAPRPPVRILARSSRGQRAAWPPASGAAAKQAGQRGRRDLALAREDCCVQRSRGSLPAGARRSCPVSTGGGTRRVQSVREGGGVSAAA